VPDEHHYLNSTTDYHPNTTNQQDHQKLLYAATKAEVYSVTINLKNKTSVAHDSLKISTLKACIDSPITPITTIANKSLSDALNTNRI
jgi:hypothetical protein